MNYTNNGTARMSYDRVKQTLYNAWIKNFGGNSDQCWAYVESLKLAQNEVRLENKLTAANTNYLFGTTPQQVNTSGVKFNTEQRMNQQDTLVASEFGIFVGLPSSDTDIFWELQTYADPFIFGAADAALINGALFSNGQLKMSVNNDVIIPGRGVFGNLYKPQTQQTAAVGAASPMNQIRGADDGFVTAEPNLYLIGSKNTVPEIILPGVLTGLAATTARIVIVFRGILAQNSTVVS